MPVNEDDGTQTVDQDGSSTGHCYILDLPLELRQMIYEYLSCDRKLPTPSDGYNGTTAALLDAPMPSLLLTGRQKYTTSIWTSLLLRIRWWLT